MSEDRQPAVEQEPIVPPQPQINPFSQSPVAAPMSPGDLEVQPGEAVVRIRMLKPLLVTLDPADPLHAVIGGNRVDLRPGEYDIPAGLADHWYVQAQLKANPPGAFIVRRTAPAPEPATVMPATPEAHEVVEPQPVPGPRPPARSLPRR